MGQYILDTNMVTHVVKGQVQALSRLKREAESSDICVSSITRGEIFFGLAKRPEAKNLHQLMHEFFKRVDVFPWTDATAKVYGTLRAELEKKGKTMGPLDLLIAAHALERESILVSCDKAFHKIKNLEVEDWTV